MTAGDSAAPKAAPEPAGVTLLVDGVTMPAEPNELLIAACERNGVYIPRFCYHPRLAPVGMCRMCLVDVDTGRGPALQPACVIPVAEGMKVETASAGAVKAQEGVLEFLLINHPLDCPICDKGGECPLQDQTMSHGPGESRFIEPKRHFEKPIAISDTVYLDRERCILCDRCTRFADQVAGDTLIHFMDRGDTTQVNTFPDEPFASYFSGNTVQICPVGALTAVPYRFKARPWDLSEAISTAWVDSVGARIEVQSSHNQVLRVLGVDSDAVNQGWLSDKERFGFEALNSPNRLTEPLQRSGDGFVPIAWAGALHRITELLRSAPPERIAVLGGARLDNESQYAWAKLAKGVLGTDNVDAQLGDGLEPGLLLDLWGATIDDACRPGGTVVLLGPDPKEQLGSLYLRLRGALRDHGVTLVELTPCETGLSSLAAHALRPRPGETAALAAALVAAAADREVQPAAAGVPADAVRAAAEVLRGDVTVILGRASPAEPEAAVGSAALALAGLPSVRFLSALSRGNVHGALVAGLAPGLLPGGVALDSGPGPETWPRVPAATGSNAGGVLRAAAAGEIDVLVLLGCDPLNDFRDRTLASAGLDGAAAVIALDMFVNDSVARAAEIVLAVAGPTETSGSFTNLEGRLSPLARLVTPPGTARADWMIAADLALRLGFDLGFDSPAAIRAELARVSPLHAALTEQALAGATIEGLLLERGEAPDAGLAGVGQRAATGLAGGPSGDVDEDGPSGDELSGAGSGAAPAGKGLLLVASRRMYDDGVMLRNCASSKGLAAPARARLNPADMARLGIEPEAAIRLESTAGSLEAGAAPDAGVPPGVVAVDWLAPGSAANALIEEGRPATEVTVAVIGDWVTVSATGERLR